MLVLTRKLGQKIRIGDDISLEVLDVNGDHVKIGISAPSNITILREEIYQTVECQNKDSVLNRIQTFDLSGLKFDLITEKPGNTLKGKKQKNGE